MLFVINPSLMDLIMGTPPATAASNSRLILFFSANLDNSLPYFEIKDLFAVTTCFLFLRELKTNFFAAPSEPPLLKKKLIRKKNIIIDSKSGYSGAGKNLKEKFKHKNLYSAIHPYSISKHRHLGEIDQELFKASNSKVNYVFTPHLIPTFRGLLSSIYLEVNKKVSVKKIYNELIRFHKKNYFVKVVKMNKNIGTENVINSNFCEISVCKLKHNKILILSAIDNLIKGAGGQAVQNMNLIFGFKEKSGLK